MEVFILKCKGVGIIYWNFKRLLRSNEGIEILLYGFRYLR